MMIEYSFGMKDEANDIKEACRKSIENGIVTEDLAEKDQKGYGTTEVGEYICSMI